MRLTIIFLVLNLPASLLYSQYVFKFREPKNPFVDHQLGPVPKWSPNGDKLALITNVGNRSRILIISGDSVDFIDGAQNNFQWSDEGNSIVYTAKEKKRELLRIYKYNVLDKSTTPISNTRSSAFFPTVSTHDNAVVYYVYDVGPVRSQLYYWKGNHNEKLIDDPTADYFHPFWSPSGDHLIYVKDTGDLEVMKVESREVVFRLNYIQNEFLGWSPDGTEILVKETGGALARVNFTTGQRIQVTSQLKNIISAEWSPKGNMICVVTGDMYLDDQNEEIHLLSPDGQFTKPIAKGFFASWHPSGMKIIFVRAYKNQAPIYEVDIDGDHLRLLYDGKETHKKK